jgi:type IV pilus assembly protein PilY1
MMNARISITALAAAVAATLSSVTPAQTTFTEDFTGAGTTNAWYYYNGACLTAGSTSGTGTSGLVAGQVPSCASIMSSYYARAQDADASLVGGNSGTLPDPRGSGALRFTNGYPYGHGENGAIVSGSAFNAGQGVQITFKTVTYRGDSGGTGQDGADGMSFYLIDATQFPIAPSNPTSSTVWNGIGSWGGSLGYTCSNANPPYDGLVGAYLGLGIDEYGNFLNGVNLEPGAFDTGQLGDNTALGFGYVPGRIGLRGYGSISWASLNSRFPTYYPTALSTSQRQAAVQNTCKTGTLWNYGIATPSNTGTTVADYAPIVSGTSPVTGAFSVLTGVSIANESALTRPAATPIFYNLKITQDGLLSFSYSNNGGTTYNPVITAQSISASNGALPSQLYFGFAGSTGGDTNIHEILCFKAVPINQSTSSASGNEKQTSEVQQTSQAYFAYYDPNDWTGRLTAYGLTDTGGILTLQPQSSWDAQCVLTGVLAGSSCATSLVAGPTAAEPPASRVMLTWNGLDTAGIPGTAGVKFETGGITAAELANLDAGDASSTNANRLNYLRGTRSPGVLEINSAGAGLFRARDGVLGDIVDSSPVWVGAPNSPYVLTWQDRFVGATDLTPENSASYLAFQTAQQSRLNVVYVGANDGFLHGFRSGTEDINGNINNTAVNDGQEILAYMPGTVLNDIHQYSSVARTEATDVTLDYSNTQYAHNFFIDATPGTGDLFYAGAWHTWLVGGLGAGGAAIYALDITNPTTSVFAETNAAAVVKGEWSASTITCVGNNNCGKSLGNTYGTPQIRRFHNGKWGAVFGNGYGSSNGDAGIFVMTVDQTSGAVLFYYLSAGAGTGNGIAYVAPADLDGDHITDYVYAGDLKGNVWRFDLTSGTATSWAAPTAPMFTTASGQPITTQLVLASAIVAGGNPQLMVAFGTGQRTQFTNTTALTYVSGSQSLYGVWDWNLSTWNATSAAQYSSLTTTQARAAGLTSPFTMGPSNLQAQSFTVTAAGVDTSNTAITWEQCTTSSSCNAGLFGWRATLPNTNLDTTGANGTGSPITEQIVSTPSLFQGAFIVNSTVPASNSPLVCTAPSTDTGVLYVVSVINGGTFSSASTGGGPTSFASAFVNFNDTKLAGLATNTTGSVTILTTLENTNFVLGQDIAVPALGSAAPGTLTQINLPLNTATNRVTWIELR